MTAAVKRSPDFMTFVYSRRRAIGLTIPALAERAGVDPSYITRIERGERTPSDRHVTKLAAALEVDPIDLFYALGRIAPALRGNDAVRLALHRAAHPPQETQP